MLPESFVSLTSVEFLYSWRLVIAVLLGALMGIERSLAGKHAGMRTYALVSLGSCVFAIVGILASMEMIGFSGLNPLQIASSVVIGIGFIGTGLAAFRGEHSAELTTASGVWVVSAVGLACGFGLFFIAIVGTLLSIIVFSIVAGLEHWLLAHVGSKKK